MLDVELVSRLACPVCRAGGLIGPDALARDAVRCSECGERYAVDHGIPVLVPAGHERASDGDHKRRQAAFFDEAGAVAEYEISRPHGTPAFHRWLLEEKFRRSVAGLEPIAAGTAAIVVCGGSGMDAEFLARAGARVLTSDISLGAARRARERARRYGVALTSIVADAERLPLAERAIDLAYVHDGLHHLEDPGAGLAEMARVAGAAISVTEPADAAVTALAVRLGVALEREEAGNRVARLTLSEVTGALRDSGFSIVTAERYAMFYRHEAGPVSRLLSRGRFLPLAKTALSGVNRLAGGIGNKLTVQAVRTEGDVG